MHKLYSRRLLLLLPAISLLVVMLWAIGGVNYQFLAERNAIRKEIKKKIKEGVSQSEMQVFQLTEIENEPGFRWENDHEFFYRGSMYDVVRREGNNLHCINDDQETVLFRNLDEQSRKAQRENGNSGKSFALKWVMEEALLFRFFDTEEKEKTFSAPAFYPEVTPDSVFLPPDMQHAV